MLGQAHTPRRRLLPFVAVALAVLVAPAVGGANPSQSVASLRAHDAAIAAKSRAAVLGLYSLDQQLANANARLGQLHAQLTTLRAERASLRHQLVIARRGTRIAQHGLAMQIRTLYEQGNVEPLEIVFGAKSLDQAMANLDSLHNASDQSEAVLAQLHLAKTQLARTSRTLARRETALATATSEAIATADALTRTRTARAQYISSLSAERAMTHNRIDALVAQARAAQLRTEQLAAARAAAPVDAPVSFASTAASTAAPTSSTPAAPVPAGARTLTVTATGYALSGTTATGLPVGWGIVAVDPSVIPLGTHMTVPGTARPSQPTRAAPIVGGTIDLWFPTVAQADAWGRRTVTIVLH